MSFWQRKCKRKVRETRRESINSLFGYIQCPICLQSPSFFAPFSSPFPLLLVLPSFTPFPILLNPHFWTSPSSPVPSNTRHSLEKFYKIHHRFKRTFVHTSFISNGFSFIFRIPPSRLHFFSLSSSLEELLKLFRWSGAAGGGFELDTAFVEDLKRVERREFVSFRGLFPFAGERKR